MLQKSFQDLLRKQVGERSVWEYPFAVAGINITFMLIQMLDLEAGIWPQPTRIYLPTVIVIDTNSISF